MRRLLIVLGSLFVAAADPVAVVNPNPNPATPSFANGASITGPTPGGNVAINVPDGGVFSIKDPAGVAGQLVVGPNANGSGAETLATFYAKNGAAACVITDVDGVEGDITCHNAQLGPDNVSGSFLQTNYEYQYVGSASAPGTFNNYTGSGWLWTDHSDGLEMMSLVEDGGAVGFPGLVTLEVDGGGFFAAGVVAGSLGNTATATALTVNGSGGEVIDGGALQVCAPFSADCGTFSSSGLRLHATGTPTTTSIAVAGYLVPGAAGLGTAINVPLVTSGGSPTTACATSGTPASTCLCTGQATGVCAGIVAGTADNGKLSDTCRAGRQPLVSANYDGDVSCALTTAASSAGVVTFHFTSDMTTPTAPTAGIYACECAGH